MTSMFNESILSYGNKTISYNLTTTTDLEQADSFTGNYSIEPHSADPPDSDGPSIFFGTKTPEKTNHNIKWIVSLVGVVFTVIICIIIVSRYYQHTKKQQKSVKERICSDRLHAKPFELIPINIDESQPTDLLEMSTLSPATTTITTPASTN